MLKNRICVYLVNNQADYLKMVKNSVLTYVKHNKIPVKVIHIDRPDETFKTFCFSHNIEIIQKSNLFSDFFLANKYYLGDLNHSSILFLDGDTFVFGNVEKIFNFYENYDFVACENSWAYHQGYQLDFMKYKPFNGGIQLFNNFSHQKIFPNFLKTLSELLNGETNLGKWLQSSNNRWTAEEFTISRLVSDLNCAYFEREFCYNIKYEEDFHRMKESIVFHSYKNQWNRCCRILNHKTISTKLIRREKIENINV